MAVVAMIARARWPLLVGAFAFLLINAPSFAQRAMPEPVPLPGSMGTGGAAGVGGGAGLLAPQPPALRSAPAIAPAPLPAPALPPAPAAPLVKQRCQLPSAADSCRLPEASDGGGGDDDCNCARDTCYDVPDGFRVCQKQ